MQMKAISSKQIESRNEAIQNDFPISWKKTKRLSSTADDVRCDNLRDGNSTMKASSNNFFPDRNVEKSKAAFDEPSGSEGFAKFCQQTSLHGWAYLDSEPGFLRKVIWIIVLVCDILLKRMGLLCSSLLNKFTLCCYYRRTYLISA